MSEKTLLSPPLALTPWHWGWAAAIAAIVLVTAAFRYALPIRDGDIWFHMLYGKYFLEFKTLIADHTIFSWSPSTNDNIYCTWLSSISLYLLHKAGGLPGFFAFQYLCLAVLPLGCFYHARRLKIVSHPVVWVFCLLAVIMSYTAIHAKPEMFTFLFMTLAAWNWWHIRSGGAEVWRNCYLFPAIMLVWVNSHGGFAIGCAFFCIIGLGEMLNVYLSPDKALSPTLRKHLFLALLLAVGAVFLTPYGYAYPLYLLHTMLPTKENLDAVKEVSSYASTFSGKDLYNLALAANVSMVLLAMILLRNLKQLDWTTILANLFFAILYTRMFRTTFYWPPVLLFSVINLLALKPMVPEGWRSGARLTKVLPPLALVVALLLAGSTLYKGFVAPERWLWTGFGISEATPVSEANYIKQYFPKARICNTYNQGSYLLWELWPDNKVFIDARHFPYRDWIAEYRALVDNPKENLADFTKKFPSDIWCVNILNTELVRALLESGEWRMAFYGKSAAVLVQKGIPLPRPAFRASEEIYNVRSIATSTELLRFTASIGDWETSEKLLKVAQERFAKTEAQKRLLTWHSLFLPGYKAYMERDYLRAVTLLARVDNSSLVNVREIRVNVLFFLARSAWHSGDTVSAWKHLLTAQQVEGSRLSLLYNLGVVEWWLQITGNQKSFNLGQQGGGNITAPNWRLRLSEYVSREKADSATGMFRQTAAAILAGKQTTRPDLFVPPEPRNRNFLTEGL